MQYKRIFRAMLCGSAMLCISMPAFSVSAIATINVTVARFLSIKNINSLEFGSVSVSSSAGSVLIDANGMRFASGGVTINPAGSFAPAKFIVEGKPDADFAIILPNTVELRDGNGNTIKVDNFKANAETSKLDSNGLLEITVGGQINLDANQTSGDYSGIMILELGYS